MAYGLTGFHANFTFLPSKLLRCKTVPSGMVSSWSKWAAVWARLSIQSLNRRKVLFMRSITVHTAHNLWNRMFCSSCIHYMYTMWQKIETQVESTCSNLTGFSSNNRRQRHHRMNVRNLIVLNNVKTYFDPHISTTSAFKTTSERMDACADGPSTSKCEREGGAQLNLYLTFRNYEVRRGFTAQNIW